MKLHILVLLLFGAVLMSNCSGDSSSGSSSNLNRTRAANSSSVNNEDNSETTAADAEKQARVRQKVQEFVAANYAGWTLKGTGNIAKSPLDLHLVKLGEEKVVKVNYKEFGDLNGQPYIVVTKIAESDLREENQEEKPKATGTVENRSEKTPSPSPSGD